MATCKTAVVWRGQGLCPYCGHPTNSGKATCDDCLTKLVAQRQQRKIHGLCLACCALLTNGKSCCNVCLKKAATKRKENKSQGLCHDCGQPASNGKACCDKCLKKAADQRGLWVSQGLCSKCGRLTLEGTLRCKSCLRKKATQRARRISKGLCRACGAVAITHRSFCVNCSIINRLRSRLRNALKRKKVTKSKKTLELVGCTLEDLKSHLESKFQENMSWENYGSWHIDHIRPCDSFDLTDPEQQRACFNWKNLQPLWARENLVKGSKWHENCKVT